jgi:hypothetical protein
VKFNVIDEIYPAELGTKFDDRTIQLALSLSEILDKGVKKCAKFVEKNPGCNSEELINIWF